EGLVAYDTQEPFRKGIRRKESGTSSCNLGVLIAFRRGIQQSLYLICKFFLVFESETEPPPFNDVEPGPTVVPRIDHGDRSCGHSLNNRSSEWLKSCSMNQDSRFAQKVVYDLSRHARKNFDFVFHTLIFDQSENRIVIGPIPEEAK